MDAATARATGSGQLNYPSLIYGCFCSLIRRSSGTAEGGLSNWSQPQKGLGNRAALIHLIQLAGEGGISAIPWNLIVWAVPGAIMGAFVGTRLQGRVSERASRLFFSGLFLLIGTVFLLAFTVFSARFT